MTPTLPAWRILLGIGFSCALALGLWFRFAHLGTWPLATDEFFSSSAAVAILHNGHPGFECGGSYGRGLLYHYLIAAFFLLGGQEELFLRLPSALASVLTLPALYLLVRRVGGAVPVALALVAVLALSQWQIEYARFGRMYAVFQCLAVWQCFHLLKYTDEGAQRSLYCGLILAMAGLLVWEGGVILVVLCALAMWWRQPRELLPTAMFSALLLLLLIVLNTWDARGISEVASGQVQLSRAEKIHGLLAAGREAHPTWLTLAYLLGATIWHAVLAARLRLWLLPALVQLPLYLAMLATVTLLPIIAVVGLFLVRLQQQEPIRPTQDPALTLLVFGLIPLMLLWALASLAVGIDVAQILKSMLGFPNLLYNVVLPWTDAAPRFSLFILLTLGGLASALMLRPQMAPVPVRFLFAVVAVGIICIGSVPVPYSETRYSHFFYPLLLVLSAIPVIWSRFNNTTLRGTMAILGFVVLWVVLTDEVNPGRLMATHTYAGNFRTNLPEGLELHYYGRRDYRSAADHVLLGEQTKADAPALVITAAVAVTWYLPTTSHVLLDPASIEFATKLCNNGNTERWTNLPVLTSLPETLQAIADSPSGAWILLPTDLQHPLFRSVRNKFRNSPSWTTEDGSVQVLRVLPGQARPEST